MAETLEQKKARLQAERDKLNKRLRQIDSKEAAKKRKEETRLKVIAGAIVLKAAKEGKAMTPAEVAAEAKKELTKAPKAKAAPKCQCGADMIRGSWKRNGESVEGWHCKQAWIGGTRINQHDIKADAEV